MEEENSYTAYTTTKRLKRPAHRRFKRFLQFYIGSIKKDFNNIVLYY